MQQREQQRDDSNCEQRRQRVPGYPHPRTPTVPALASFDPNRSDSQKFPADTSVLHVGVMRRAAWKQLAACEAAADGALLAGICRLVQELGGRVLRASVLGKGRLRPGSALCILLQLESVLEARRVVDACNPVIPIAPISRLDCSVPLASVFCSRSCTPN